MPDQETIIPDFEFIEDDQSLPIQEEDETQQVENETSTEEPSQEKQQEFNDEGEDEIIDDSENIDDEESEDEADVDENLQSLYEYYAEEGYLPKVDNFKATPEKFQELLDNHMSSLQNQVEQAYVESLPEKARSLWQYIANKGDDIQEDDLKHFFSDTTKPVESEDDARLYLEKIYKERGLADNIVEKLIETHEDDDELLDIAQQEFEKEQSKLKEEQEKLVNETKEQKQKRLQKQQEFQDNVAGIVMDQPWDDSVKEEVFQEIFSGNLRQKTAQLVNHPKALAQLANYMRYFDPKTGEIDESVFRKQAFSKQNKKTKSAFERSFSSSSASRSGTRTQKKRKSQDIDFSNFEIINE